MMREGGKTDEGGAPAGAGEMHKRRTTMEDGRYLIYYTFGEGGGAAEPNGEAARGPRPEPQAEDERSV